MSKRTDRILKIEVPVIVQLAERTMSVEEVLRFVPGTIIELPKDSDDDLDLMINNQTIGTGNAVKVGENFGLRINFIGDAKERLDAILQQESGAGDGAAPPAAQQADAGSDEDDAMAAMAAALLSGQG